MSNGLKKEYLEDLDNYNERLGIHPTSYKNCRKRLTRLAKIDKLQKQLGCSLDVIHKALKNGVYVEGDKDKKLVKTHACLEYNGSHFVIMTTLFLVFRKTKNYKKTWWLKEDKSE